MKRQLNSIVAMILLITLPLQATTYYISPTGSDLAAGTSGAPWKTFAYATSSARLFAGDTLVLKDGTYTLATSGMFSANCNSGANHGTSGLHITIRADNERQAYILSDGSQAPIKLLNCNYWDFNGIRAKSADMAGGDGSVMTVFNSDNVGIHRMLLEHPNSCINDHVVSVYGDSDNGYITQSEVYDYWRHGIALQESSDNWFVQFNYINSRSRADAGCAPFASDPTNRGDSGIVLYPSSNTYVENNIIEDVGTGVDIEASNTQIASHMNGNAVLNANYGWRAAARGNTLTLMPRDNTIRDLVTVNVGYGIYARGAKNTQVNQASIHGTGTHGLAADDNGGEDGDGSPSIFVTNYLVTPAKSAYDYYFAGQASFSGNYFAVTGTKEPETHASITNTFASAPTNLSSCYIYIPTTSNLKAAGAGGLDIGGEFLYEYSAGTKTSTALWSASGFVRSGVVVAGVNDVAGSSLSNVASRLRVNSGGCSFPAGYPPSGGTSGSSGVFRSPIFN